MAHCSASRPSALIAATLIALAVTAGVSEAQATKERAPRLAGGVLGAAQQAAFRVTDGTASFEQRIGWAGGVWLNLRLGRFFSLEPQVQYSSVPSLQTEGQRPRAFLNDATINWLSAPLVLKVHLGPVALSAGGQADYAMAVVDDPNLITVDDLPAIGIAATGGVELFPRSRVTLYGRYIYGLTNLDDRGRTPAPPMLYNQSIMAGVKLRLFGGRSPSVRAPEMATVQAPAPALQVASIADVDGDKVPDAVDKCPTVVGFERNAGCPMPDTDDDGVTDAFDKCPQAAGPVRNEGCLPTDSDRDGVDDEDDKCPTVAGTREFAGCTTPDADRDGVLDTEDRCPGVAGVRDMMGCPIIPAFSPSAVTFPSGRIKLRPDGRNELDKVVAYLSTFPNVSVRLEGHTDNRSSDLTNNALSTRRAEAAKAYLMSRGIAESRIATTGHGSTKPTTGNGTAEGRAKNRRVEVVVR